MRIREIERMGKRVKRGVILLNNKKPGWFNKVDISNFVISNPSSCILGQVFVGNLRDGFRVGSEFLNIDYKQSMYGFDLTDAQYEILDDKVESEMWEVLATLWIAEIKKLRRNQLIKQCREV